MREYLPRFIQEIIRHRKLIFTLAVRDLRSSHLGSVLGIFWLFAEPAIYMFIMWFIFSFTMGLRPSGDRPYLPWLMTGMITWLFFSACLSQSVSVFRSFEYLLKVREIEAAIIPSIKILSTLLLHFVFIAMLIVLLLVSGETISVYWLQTIYYIVCLVVLSYGLILGIASIHLFIKDMASVVSLTLQIGFWASPIFWDLGRFSEKYHVIIKANPIYYVISGYRNSFLFHKPFWSEPTYTVYFWCLVLCLNFGGWRVYRRLRPTFGDVL